MKPSTILLAACTFAAPITACAYQPPSATESPDAELPSSPDAPDATTTSPIAPCSAPDASGVVLCLELDDGVEDGTLDDSSAGRHHATTAGLGPATRTMPSDSPAAQVHPDAVTRVPEDPALDRDAAYTFAVWIRPDTLPTTGEVFGILDHEDQYAMLIGHPAAGDVENRCVHTGVERYEWTSGLTAGAWSFLACTWDGAQLCAYRWSSPTSHEHVCHVPTVLPNATGSHGLAVGHLSEGGVAHSRLDGALDSVQIFDRGMTEDQLCTLLGRGTGCMPCTSGC